MPSLFLTFCVLENNLKKMQGGENTLEAYNKELLFYAKDVVRKSLEALDIRFPYNELSLKEHKISLTAI